MLDVGYVTKVEIGNGTTLVNDTCFLDAFEEVQCRITPEHRILRAPLEFTAKSLPATAGSTFHARDASRAKQGAPRGNRANRDKLRI